MYFILSKVLLVFIMPLNWIIACYILAFFVKKKEVKRRFLYIGTSLLIVFTNPLLLNLYAGFWNVPSAPLPRQNYSCAIILGGYAGAKNKKEGYFNYAADRFIRAIELKTTGMASYLLLSGANGSLGPSKFIESDWAAAELRRLNIPDSSVLLDRSSRNTFENALFSKQILQKNHLKPPFILVTSEFHMRRSLLIFQKAGIPVIPYSCNFMAGYRRLGLFQFFPSSTVLSNWEYYIKETIGWTYTKLFT